MEVAATTAQLVTRAEKAEIDLEMAVKAIDSAQANITASLRLLDVYSTHWSGIADAGALRLIKNFMIGILEDLEVWNIPF